MPNTATRLINLIMLLQKRPNQKAADLAHELGVSVRTLHRYINMLDQMGLPVYSERGPQGGFSLVRGYRMPPLVFSPEEAVAVYLGVSLVEEMWGRVYRGAARGAQAKLDNVLPDEQRHEIAWARRALLATGMHRTNLEALAPVLEKLRKAAREHRRVHMTYQGKEKRQPSQRDMDPYALVHRWGWWYAVGFCHLRQELRTFRVDRITGLTLMDTLFNPPTDFDLRTYLDSEAGTQPLMTVKLRFQPQVAQVAQENYTAWEKVEKQPDGCVEVTFAAPTLEWAASTALAYGPIVEVVEPAELRQLVSTWAEAILQRYSEAR
ncbi:MAG: YafY family transcriptional regulator [Anaerolineales bacterium]|nr:MAG: YafY family transcriptional regulator [Anaerolineales bacterium]